MQCTDQVPPCLRRAAKGPWARAHDKRGKASSDEAETEDEELTRDHAGYAHAILPPPANDTSKPWRLFQTSPPTRMR